jgi:hypothetical protein
MVAELPNRVTTSQYYTYKRLLDSITNYGYPVFSRRSGDGPVPLDPISPLDGYNGHIVLQSGFENRGLGRLVLHMAGCAVSGGQPHDIRAPGLR